MVHDAMLVSSFAFSIEFIIRKLAYALKIEDLRSASFSVRLNTISEIVVDPLTLRWKATAWWKRSQSNAGG